MVKIKNIIYPLIKDVILLNPIVHKFQYGQNIITLETGIMARQATSAVMVSMDDTTVFVTVVCQKKAKPEQNFFPLTVNYQERSYSVGKIPGSFFRREGRPSDSETLISRLIDRPIRPLFPKNFYHEVQIVATVVSINPQISPDIVSIIGVSAALTLSGLPFNGPIGAARIGYINNKYVLNPTHEEIKKSDLDLVISSSKEAILMVESESNFLSENKIVEGIINGYQQQKIVIENINHFAEKVGKKIFYWNIEKNINVSVIKKIILFSKNKLKKAYKITEKQQRINDIDKIKTDTIDFILKDNKNINENKINEVIFSIEKKIVRSKILLGKNRIDGREKDMIRSLDIRTGILPRTHGSALFTRGETQALVTATLGTSRDAQNLDKLIGEKTDSFLFHYNFPPYSVGETGLIGAPKRREIGHGNLAKRSILAVMPKLEVFPYTIRIVAEITESNGSSSMASVCGASLALMDAGVPIKSAVAGVAMGLIKKGNKFVILSDILGDEDYLGDMDFKVAGNRNGITSLQMDIKIEGITSDIIHIALNQAKGARLHILSVMEQAISLPRKEISQFAPRIYTIKIQSEKIKDLIGKGGSVIRSLTEETGTTIEISDDGIVKIAAINNEKAQYTIKRIQEITSELEIGKKYKGKVVRIASFGAFVSILNSKEGLLHISQIAEKRIEKVTDYLSIGQEIIVTIIEIDRHGRLRLSMK